MTNHFLPDWLAGGFGVKPPEEELSDPDPFAIAFTILAIIFGGGSYLEGRRQREFLERQARDEFRKAWFDSRRTLIHAKRVVEEFATYAAEDQFGTTHFLFGSVKLTIDRGRAQQLRRLHGNAHTTAEHLADDLDRLGDFIGSEYQPQIDEIHSQLRNIAGFPELIQRCHPGCSDGGRVVSATNRCDWRKGEIRGILTPEGVDSGTTGSMV